MESSQSREPMPKLALAALGVVFGDIGTSPLYALRACLTAGGDTLPSPQAVLGVLSLIFWAIALTITLKYVVIVLRNDNRGEGGVLALTALLASERSALSPAVVVALGLAGTALFFGDGSLTPAVTVLSAVEGLTLADPAFGQFVVPLTVVVLVFLFRAQHQGTGVIGVVFGPIMLLWFCVLGVLGIVNIVGNTGVLAAINPAYALGFVVHHGGASLAVLAGAFLAVTGGEALYADLGHFGRRPIQLAWLYVVWPGLLLNYFGQGALLLEHPEALRNPFYLMAPLSLIVPLVLLAAAASVIASQAVISGVFSIAQQAQQLGFLPRMQIKQTSDDSFGQVYVPAVNWVLCCAAISIVIVFKSSEALANAYGIAVSSTMVIETTLLVALLYARHVGAFQSDALAYTGAADAGSLGVTQTATGSAWMLWLLLPLGLLDVVFFVANVQKIPAGGWFPLVFGGVVYLVMRTWQIGRITVSSLLLRQERSVASFLEQCVATPPIIISGAAVFLTSNTEGVPRTLVRNLRFNGVMHETTVVMSMTTERIPRVPLGARVKVVQLAPRLWRVNAKVGFKEDADVPELLRAAERLGLTVRTDQATYFLARDQVVIGPGTHGMSAIRKRLFLFMARNALFAGAAFKLPPERIVEVGGRVVI
jgi:KUP system potassium uptake protein